MIEIEMSQDIRDYAPKILGPLSLRQLIFTGAGVAIGFPVFALMKGSVEIRLAVAVILAAPFFMCGFLKLFGMNAEVFLMKVMLPYFLNPRARKYETENTMDYLTLDPDSAGADGKPGLIVQKRKKKTRVRHSSECRPRR